MEIEEAGKIAEEIMRQNSHKTTKKTLRDLESDEFFQKDVSGLRKKWDSIIKKANIHFAEAQETIVKFTFNKITLPKIEKVEDADPVFADLANRMKNLTQKEQKQIAVHYEKYLLTLANRDLTNDIIEICKKHRLSPIDIWLPQIRTYAVLGQLNPPDFFLTAGLSGYLSKDEIIHAPQDLNFIPKIETNSATGEKKLVVEFLPNTTLKQDFGKHWKIIDKIQKLLRIEKGIKRFHPVKNQEIAEKVAELDKQKTETYFDPLSKKPIETKMTDIDKALKVYDDVPFGKKEELKAGNRIKQIRHQQKKRSKPPF
ncbi:MAG: hypothetical protein NTW11_00050 [Candidatus Staskawiczbacteria bacterium]|nr:hypothetical protein [Candidatus Staskawiczbacteria bacterium]